MMTKKIPCIICDNKGWKYLYPAQDRMLGLAGKFSEYQCTSCGFVRLAPQPRGKKLSGYYPAQKYYSYGVGKETFFSRLRKFLISRELFGFVPAMPKPGKRGNILDVGCGSGDTLALLQSLGWKGYGLELDAGAIKIARKRGVKNASVGSYRDMKKYPDNFFQAIRLYHVIEHLDDPEACLRLAYKKLAPGGEIIIGTPNIDSLVAKLAKTYWYNLDCPRHLYLFTPGTLKRLTERCGFGKIQVSFSSAGGWVGSLQYILAARGIQKDFIHKQWLVMLVNPFERVLDLLGMGDVFVLTAAKRQTG